MDETMLIKKAYEASERAYAPYSEFCVGAALLTASGRVFTGCNVENASYGATNCAERTALFKAVSEGERAFSAIAVVGRKRGGEEQLCPPCGICRQVLAEFCNKDFLILLTNGKETERYTLEELLPHSFDRENI
ncbi:MAG: cytidine deaminase [Ruminococcaceae bacterium]|nr:cytidine deaminase [Oscillospiraceae bacterium]